MKTETRELLLDSAFKTFYHYGYQGAKIASILKEVGINKGSMYHFFKSKKALALAVIEERISRNLRDKYILVLESDDCIKLLFKTLRLAPQTLIYGCPLNKMSQEMVYVDEAFKTSLSKVYEEFESIIEKILNKGIEDKEIKPCHVKQTAKLIIATYEGALMIYHLNQDRKSFEECLVGLEDRLRKSE
jgi:TetR/AcrR family transcriptional repressor of nem operon